MLTSSISAFKKFALLSTVFAKVTLTGLSWDLDAIPRLELRLPRTFGGH
jgi:hypothetical protein